MPASTMAPPMPTTTPMTVLRVCGVMPVLPEFEPVLARSGVVVDTFSLAMVVDWPLALVVVMYEVLVEVMNLGGALLEVVDVVVVAGGEDVLDGGVVCGGVELGEGLVDGGVVSAGVELCGVDDVGVVETGGFEDVGVELELCACEVDGLEESAEVGDVLIPSPGRSGVGSRDFCLLTMSWT